MPSRSTRHPQHPLVWRIGVALGVSVGLWGAIWWSAPQSGNTAVLALWCAVTAAWVFLTLTLFSKPRHWAGKAGVMGAALMLPYMLSWVLFVILIPSAAIILALLMSTLLALACVLAMILTLSFPRLRNTLLGGN